MRFLSFFTAILGLGLMMAPCASAQSSSDSNTLYNQNAKPLSLDQAVSGRNAPSYDFGRSATSQTYKSGGNQTYQSEGTLTPEQEAQFERQYLEQEAFNQELIRQQLANGQVGQDNSYAAQLARLTGGETEDEAPKERKVKRVVRNALNDPLQTPPRLFNPDQ